MTLVDVLRAVAPSLPPLKQIVDPGLPNAILALEEKQVSKYLFHQPPQYFLFIHILSSSTHDTTFRTVIYCIYSLKQTIRGFKFGILYAAEGQTKEDEMFSNQASSPEFEEFLDFLGDRVPLHGWPNFRAG